MATDEYGNYIEDEDPYRYADYTNPDGSTHSYDPGTGQEWTGPAPGSGPDYGWPADSNPGPWAEVYGPEPQAAAPAGAPTTPTTQPRGQARAVSSGGGGGDSGGGYSFPQFNAPDLPNIAPFVAPKPFSYDPFSYESFRAPSIEDAYGEPGYQFAQQQGIKALENSKAAQGTLRTGGTLKDILSWGNKFGEQNYGNVYNRAANTYGINRNNAFENYGTNRDTALNSYTTNFGVSKDAYNLNLDRDFGLWDRDLQGSLAEFNPSFRAAELNFDDMFRRWQSQLNATTQVATAGMQ